MSKSLAGAIRDVERLTAENERLEGALRKIDAVANWVGRRNAWNRMPVRAGQPPTADDACREVRLIVRAVLEG